MNQLQKRGLGFVAVLTAALSLAVPAFATPPTPEESITSFVTDAFGDLLPMLLAVAGASIGLLVFSIGLRSAYGAIKSKGKKSPA